MSISLTYLMTHDGFECSCGKRHYSPLKDCFIGEGVISKLPEIINSYGCTYPYLLCDSLTYAAAGEKAVKLLENNRIKYAIHEITRLHPASDEKIVGEALMFCPNECDIIIAVGGGVINDTCKIIAAAKKVPDIFVATAPSMDGFASETSSMERCGLKWSINSKCPECVIGDSEILSRAPTRMILSGIGDMVAKYISLVEWKISHIITGEYYCQTIADIVASSLDICMKSAKAAVNSDKAAIERLTEGLVMSGICMNYAGISRPASGVEHSISHIIDMRALEFGTPSDFHGIQCGVGTLIALQAYERLREVTVDHDRALAYVNNFSLDDWFAHLREKIGHGAEAMIAGELKEHKYAKENHAERLALTINNFYKIKQIATTLPSYEHMREFFIELGHPVSGTQFGLSADDVREAFIMAKDLRFKYFIGHLLWDIGLLEEFADNIKY